MKTYEVKRCGPDTTCGVFLCGSVLRISEDMWVFRRKNVGLLPSEWEIEVVDKKIETPLQHSFEYTQSDMEAMDINDNIDEWYN